MAVFGLGAVGLSVIQGAGGGEGGLLGGWAPRTWDTWLPSLKLT